MPLSTRAIEGLIAWGSSALMLAESASVATTSDPASALLALVETLTKASPAAILATFLIVLWKRYTAREDEHTQLTREAITTMQEVRDALKQQKQ